MTNKRLSRLLVFVAMLIMCAASMGVFAPTASAHASLTKATPEPNTPIAEVPEHLVLTFNERLEAELYYMKVYDELGRIATDNKATLSQDQRTMTLELPRLPQGRYTISYHVISADGHPVEGTYVLPIGPAAGGAGDPSSLHHNHGLSASITPYEALVYASRIAYFAALLALVGWVFWGAAARLAQEAIAPTYRAGLLVLQRAHLLALISFIYFHYQDLLGDAGLEQLPALFSGTWVGRSWVAALVLALVGFVLLGRARKWDFAWIALLLGSKMVNGHAMGNEPQWLTLPLDFIHLLAASVWVGGLLLLIWHWNKQRAWVHRFMPVFSNAALLAIVALTVSGLASTLLYLPSLSYLLYAQWGKIWIAKLVFVIVVLFIALGIRIAMKKRKDKDVRDLVRLDVGAMSAIVILVAFLTFVSPVPPNEPLYWHHMGEKVHVTMQVSPKVPGDNQFRVDVWLPRDLGDPKQVQLRIHNMDKKEMAPIDVPLAIHRNEQDDAQFIADDTLSKYSYRADGPFLPFAGLWKLEFRLMTQQDDETVYETETRVY